MTRCFLNVHLGKRLILLRLSMCSHHIACQPTGLACRYNWLCPAFEISKQYLIAIKQVGNDILYQLSRLRISPELRAAKVSRRKMDEACRPYCVRGLQLLNRHVNSLNIFIWSIALCSHAACKSFAGLLTVRFILGMCEGSITAGFMIVSSMFYTRREHTTRVGYWCECYDQLPNPRVSLWRPRHL